MLRFEDDRLLTGHGRYVDDRTPDGTLTMMLFRAPVANGVITHLDVDAARSMPGVQLVLTAADLGALGVGPMTAAR